MFQACHSITRFLFILFLLAGVFGCTQVEEKTVGETAVSIIQPTLTSTSSPTDIPQPTATPTQTIQPSPTAIETASPTSTITPSPTPSLQNLSASESLLINVPRTDFPISNMDDPNVNDIAVSPDNKYLAVASNQGLLIFDLITLELVIAVDEDGSTKKSVAWSSDGTLLAIGSGPRVWIWNFSTQITNHEFSGHGVEMRHVTWSPNTPIVASVANNGSFGLWDIETVATRVPITPPLGIRTIQFSPDGSLLSLNQGDKLLTINVDGNNQYEFSVEHNEKITSLSWHPAGHLIVSGSNDHTLRIWDIEQRRSLMVLEKHTDAVLDVAWSPKGNFIASSSVDLTTLIWDVDTGEAIYRLRGHSDDIRAVVWFNDGSHLVTGSRDGTIRIWKTPATE